MILENTEHQSIIDSSILFKPFAETSMDAVKNQIWIETTPCISLSFNAVEIDSQRIHKLMT